MTGPCRRCGGRPANNGFDVCVYCQHLDHTTTAHGCTWCDASPTGADAGRKAGRAAAESDPEFTHNVQRALVAVRNRREPFTAAEVRAEMENHGILITRPAAIGAVFTSAHAAGIIRPNGDFVPSPVKGQHSRPLRVWVAA